MHLEAYQDVLSIITNGIAIVMLSSLAAWKVRNPLGWGLIGALFFPTSFIWKLRRCPTLESQA